MLAKERTLQEESEKRWALLIDQARTETKGLQKKHDDAIRKQSDKIEALQNNAAKLQGALTATQVALNHKSELIESQNQQLEKLQYRYTSATSELAVLKSKLEGNAVEKVARSRHSETV